MLLGMDENYENVLEAFLTNGAKVTADMTEKGIVRIPDEVPGDQLFVLSNTNEALDKEKEVEETHEKEHAPQYIKLPDNNYDNGHNEAANVNIPILLIIAIAEVIILGVYYIFILN